MGAPDFQKLNTFEHDSNLVITHFIEQTMKMITKVVITSNCFCNANRDKNPSIKKKECVMA